MRTATTSTLRKTAIGIALAAVVFFIFFDGAARIKAASMGILDSEETSTLIETSIANNDYDDLMALLTYGTEDQVAYPQHILEYESQRLPAAFSTKFMYMPDNILHAGGLSRVYRARMHLHYDLLRCGRTDLVSKLDHINWDVLDIAQYKNLVLMREKDLYLRAHYMKKAFDFEGKHPIESDPGYTCKQLLRYGAAPDPMPAKETWPELRRQMREATQEKVKLFEAEAERVNTEEKTKKKAATP